MRDKRMTNETTENMGHDGLYEISFRPSGSAAHKVVLEACSRREAIEIFESLPELKGMPLEAAEINVVGILRRVYWVE